MKKILFIPLLFIYFVSLGQDVNSESIIGKSIRIGNIEVAQNDFPDRMNWDDAKKACEVLGKGWRLPTKDEWNTLFQNKEKIGGFTGKYYWSSTEFFPDPDPDYEAYASWVQDLDSGLQGYEGKDDKGGYVRAIRAFEEFVELKNEEMMLGDVILEVGELVLADIPVFEPFNIELLQGEWQSQEDEASYMVIEGDRMKTYYGGMDDELDNEIIMISDACMNASNSKEVFVSATNRYLSNPNLDICWYVEYVDATNLTLIYMATGNYQTYKRVDKKTQKLIYPENNFDALITRLENKEKNVAEYNNWLLKIVTNDLNGDSTYVTTTCLAYIGDAMGNYWGYDEDIDEKILKEKWGNRYDLKYSNFGHLFENGNSGWMTKKLTKIEYLGELNDGDWFKLTINGGVDLNDYSNTLIRIIKVVNEGNNFYIDNFLSLSDD